MYLQFAQAEGTDEYKYKEAPSVFRFKKNTERNKTLGILMWETWHSVGFHTKLNRVVYTLQVVKSSQKVQIRRVSAEILHNLKATSIHGHVTGRPR